MRSEVFFAAMMPAILATPSTSPFLDRFSLMSACAVVSEKWTLQTAMAVRFVGALSDIETMCASPEELRCVSAGLGLMFESSDGVVIFDRGADVVENRRRERICELP